MNGKVGQECSGNIINLIILGPIKTIISGFDCFESNKKQLSLSLIALLPFGTIIVAANLETVPQFVCLVQKQKTARDP